jgi:hypothetical protein
MQPEKNGEAAAEHDGDVRGKREGEEKKVVAATDALNIEGRCVCTCASPLPSPVVTI